MLNNWPKPDYESMSDFYGRFELNSEGEPTERWESSFLCRVDIPYPMRLSWKTDEVVHKLTCNVACRSSLMNILDRILKMYGSMKEVQDAGMDLYGGCYNFRRARGTGKPSMHSWGAAIDLNPDQNPLGKKWEKGMMPMCVVQLFEDEGWTWGGRWKNRPDCMHFSACQE